MSKRTQLQVLAVLDTNCLFTDAADELVSKESKDLIELAKKMADLDVIWLLPSMVIKERKFQMMRREL